MNQQLLIESCPTLTISSLKSDLLRYRSGSQETGVKLDIINGELLPAHLYWFDESNGDDYLVIGNTDQRILISSQELYYGTRNYFRCDCGTRCSRLYLPHGKDYFRCRSCHHLRYELSGINRSSAHGKLMYVTNRKIKLVNSISNITRPLYKSRYTKRYTSLLTLCQKVGFDNVVIDARNLMKAIQSQ